MNALRLIGEVGLKKNVPSTESDDFGCENQKYRNVENNKTESMAV
jgi:hypothetical protein